MRLRTVMLVLALLFVPVMADAGDPREAEFSPPANEGVTIAAAAAGLAGWLYVANFQSREKTQGGGCGWHHGPLFQPPPGESNFGRSQCCGRGASVTVRYSALLYPHLGGPPRRKIKIKNDESVN